MALYPISTVLKTAMGYGIVKDVHIGMTRYPRLILFADNNNQLLPTPITIETTDHDSDFITSVVDGNEFSALCFRLKFNPASLLMQE